MKYRFACFVMKGLYYVTFVLLMVAIIFPHMALWNKNRIFYGFVQRINTKSVYIAVDEKYKIHTFPIQWRSSYKSSNFRIADVTPFGRIIARKPGTVLVHVKSNNKCYQYRVYVFALDKKYVSLKKGEKKKISIKNKQGFVRWNSQNKRIASVNRFGVVEGQKVGNTLIFAHMKGKTLTCKVKIS